jgi:hypothetical protein
LSVCALFTALTAVLLFHIVRRYVSDRIALITAVIWAFSPVVTKQAANGLETALALFMFSAVVLYYLKQVRSNESASVRNFMVLGVLVGLAVLARIDQVFVALAVLLDYLFVLRKRGSVSVGLRGVTTALVACLVVYSPWLLFNFFVMGTMVQDSGTATRFLSIAYAPLFNLGPSEMIDSGPSLAFIWGHVVKAFAVLKVSPPVHVLFRGMEKIGTSVGLSGAFGVIASLLGAALVVGLVFVARTYRDDPQMKRIGELRFLLLVAVTLMAAYSFYVFGVFFFIRYLYPIYFVACVFAAFYLALLFRRLTAKPAWMRGAAVTISVAYIGAFTYMAYTSAFLSRPTYYFYDVAEWIETNTYEDETIGVFQGGAIGYLSSRKVINLDGKVNHDALVALRNKSITSYLESTGVDVVLDNSNVLALFLGEEDHPEFAKGGYEKIMHGVRDGVPGWTAYRINGEVTRRQPARHGTPKAASSLH